MKQPTRVELVRRGQGLTMKALAEEVAVSIGLIGKVESRSFRCYPSLRKRISDALDVRETELFDSDGFARPLKLIRSSNTQGSAK